MKTYRHTLLLGTLLALAGAVAQGQDYRAEAIAMVMRDFHDKGQAKTDRLNNDVVQHICNKYGNNPSPKLAQMIEAQQLETVRFPTDGKLLGNWKSGEEIAQSGRGFTWTDLPGLPTGGNCYNCHELSPKEPAFGTVGPSLRNFGKLRGNTPEMQKYVYSKIFNAKAFNLCSAMPRFGYVGALTEKQIKDLVALLLDPESPVNK